MHSFLLTWIFGRPFARNGMTCLALWGLMMFSFSGTSAAQSDDSLAQELVRKHISINAASGTMPGYRVQIYYGVQRSTALEIKSDFRQAHGSVAAYLVYQQPNFKVRVGDCKTRLEALRLLDSIQGEYPAAFVVPDDVKLPDPERR